jgi:Holliday junction resolvase RusA-like endonuclease
MRLDIKPLSVNEAWKGRRFKTGTYSKYISDVLFILTPLDVPDGELSLSITFGLSSRAADIDNPLKCFIDCLQKKYGFDDKMIFELIVKKVIVKKGAEFIDWEIRGL